MAKMGFIKNKRFRQKYGNIPVTAIVNGRTITFKSKLEYRWAQHLDLLKTAGEIKDFFYEFHTFHFKDRPCPPYEYTPDFLVRTKENELEYYETKGMLSGFDIKKFKILFDEMPYVKLTIVFARKPKISVQKKNQLERYCHRIIWDAGKIFAKEPIDMK